MNCTGGCLSGELFGGVLVGVVVVTNAVSIILTYFITKKRLSTNRRSANVTLENAEILTNNHIQPVFNQTNATAEEHEYPGDSEFSTDSEDDIRPPVHKYNDVEKYTAATSRQQHPYQQQNPSTIDIAVTGENENHRRESEFDNAQIYDEPEGFVNVSQNKNETHRRESEFDCAQIYDEPEAFINVSKNKNSNASSSLEETDYVDVNAEAEAPSNGSTEETEYLQPDIQLALSNSPDNPPNKPERHTYENRAMQEDEYEELDNPPALPKNPPAPMTQKPKLPPKPF